MSPGEAILCYSEEPDLAVELVRVGRALASVTASSVHVALLPGSPADAADRVGRAGAQTVHVMSGEAHPDPHVVAEQLKAVSSGLNPSLLLVASTKRGREVAGRLAGALDLPAATGVTAVRIDSEGIHVDRETLSGNAVATERIARRPAIVALLPGTMGPVVEGAGPAEQVSVAAPTAVPLTERSEVRPKPSGGVDIEKADRIVTIGRGLKKKEDLALIESLAKSLGAEVGCTRPLAAEAGWLTDDHWIGLTGHRVHPKLYVAVGVSGAVQHLVGMRSAKLVVAVNKDPNAPIFGQADYRIVGDLYTVVPALTKVFAPPG